MSKKNKECTIEFNKPYLSGNEKKYINQVFDNANFAGNGPFTKQVQTLLENYFSIPHVLLTHSCTAALEISALLLNIKPGDEVLLPSYTFISTASAFLRSGAELVFCEIDPDTMNISVDDIERKITNRSRAIVPVHYGGIGSDMLSIKKLADQHGLIVIEDAAQGLGAKINNEYLGSIGSLGTISFHETKNIHCGLGGALFINDPAWFERAEDIWERGTNRAKMFKGLIDKYSWVENGSSFYPSELQAGFLLAQLESIKSNGIEREAIYNHYSRGLKPLEQAGLFKLPRVHKTTEINFHSFYLICNSIKDCDELRGFLFDNSIQAYIGYVPLHSSKMGLTLGYQAHDLPITEEYAQRVLRLPFHNDLSEENLRRIIESIKVFF
jgi:dTDP-4-amino-4,6-dideoxygalactose transaminase